MTGKRHGIEVVLRRTLTRLLSQRLLPTEHHLVSRILIIVLLEDALKEDFIQRFDWAILLLNAVLKLRACPWLW